MTPIVVGVISDTHGLVRPEVHQALAGVYCILHAGDVCGDDVLEELSVIAPVAAVAGNCDPPGHPRLPLSLERTVEGKRIRVSHGHEHGVPTVPKLLAATDADIVIYGHTHKPLVHREGDRLVLNPGAAGPRRFDIAPTVARLTIGASAVRIDLIRLTLP